MVLQRGRTLGFWGKGEAGTTIRVQVATVESSATVDQHGRWSCALPPLDAARDLTVFVSDGSTEIVFRNVCIGDVWLCSGQSNMRWTVQDSDGAAETIADANQPDIRLCHVEDNPRPEGEAEELNARWSICNGSALRDFSAVGYYFADVLRRHTEAPVGLIMSAVGGTPIEAWTPRSAMEGENHYDEILRKAGNGFGENVADREDYARQVARRTADADRATREVLPIAGDFPSLDFDDGDWVNDLHPYAQFGVVWGRKWIDVPPAWAGREVSLSLSSIWHYDKVFWDGNFLGETTFSAEAVPAEPIYRVPASFVTTGRHLVAIRIVANGPYGGLMHPQTLRLAVEINGGVQELVFRDNWLVKSERDLSPRPSELTMVGGNLFNGMIAPLAPFSIRGCLWYQGESNADLPDLYRLQFPLLIQTWRRRWGYDFPFYFVQLAGFGRPAMTPEDDDWARLREAQAAALALPRTGMATAIDVGDAEDIHPRNKRTVGERLASVALSSEYGDPEHAAHGPRFESVSVGKGTLIVKFTGGGDGLRSKDGGAVEGFSIAGTDRVFHFATVEILEDQVVVSHPEIPRPVAARYAWAKNPIANLVGGSLLPAEPFRTDSWEA